MPIIDFRARPNTPEGFAGTFGPARAQPRGRYAGPQTRRVHTHQFGGGAGGGPPKIVTIEEFIQLLDAAGVDIAVFSGRDQEGGLRISNDYIAAVQSRFPDRIVGVAGINHRMGKAAVPEVQMAAKQLGLRGISMDVAGDSWSATDARLFPIYEKCIELGLPVLLTVGPLPGGTVPMEYAHPRYIDELAVRYPELKIVACHACWPWVLEMIGVAFRHRNVYIEVSGYNSFPGAELYVEAANTIMPDKVIYGSAHPFYSLKRTLERFRQFPFRTEEIRAKVLGANAARLLNL